MTVWLYALPTVAADRDEVVMFNKEYTEIESAFVSVAPFIALALSVKETVAATRGVPEITPVALSRVRPTGSIPDITDQV